MVLPDHHTEAFLRLKTNHRTRRPATRRRLVLTLMVAALASCVPPVSPSFTVTATIPAFTRTPTASHTPVLSPTPAPSSTPSQSATPTIPTNTVVEFGQLPPGFSLILYANVTRPTSIAFGIDGRLYVASANQVVYALADLDGDRRAETRSIWASNLASPLGLLWLG